MITCSNIRAQGADYLTRHLSSNDYYSEGESIVGTWFGEGCERLGLVPGSEVTTEDFGKIGNNQKPDGSKLTASNQPDRKSWTDVQVSCPKDVSILALVAADERLRVAFDEAADFGMGLIQRYAGTRERRGQMHQSEETRITGNLVVAKYSHDASRALDPQMHKHYVAANATWDAETGRWMALQSRDMMLASRYARRAMYDHLAAACERLGYQVVNETDSGFSIEGVSDAMRAKFSQREAQIDVEAKKFEVEHGRAPTNKERAVLTRESREQKLKEITTEQVRAYQRSRLEPAEAQALAGLVASAAATPTTAAPAPPLPSPADLDARLDGALRHVTERQSVVREWDALEAVFAHKPAGVRLDAAAVSARLVERATGPDADLHTGFGSRLTTAAVAVEEADTVRLALAGRGTCAPLASLERLDATQASAEATPGTARLADDQLSAARLLAGNQDRCSVMVGDAGTGKTFLLQRLRDASEQPWIALGPTTRARDELKSNGFAESETVAAFLASPKKQAAAAGSVLLVDEAGLLDMGQMKILLEVARANNARMLLVGDPKQHNAVGRGDALRAVLDGARHADATASMRPYTDAPDFQSPDVAVARRPGLVVARLQTVRRQTSEEHRAVSDLLARGQVEEALERQVNRLQTVEEVRNERELFTRAADHYMTRRETLAAERGGPPGRSPEVLGVCRTWADIGRFSGEVRARMKERGQLGEERMAKIVQPSGWTEEETTVASKYKHGQHVVTFQQKAEAIGAKAGENWAVEAADADGLTLRRLDEAAPRQGQKRQASPRPRKIGWDDLRGVEIGELQQIPLAPGDSILFRGNCRNGKKAVANNGDVRVVKSIGKDGRVNLIGGGQVPASFKNYCYGYAVTSHKSQGASVRETVVVLGAAACTSAEVQSNYVAHTRHKENSRVFVADLDGMRSSLLRSASRGPGRELVAEMPVASTSSRRKKERLPVATGAGKPAANAPAAEEEKSHSAKPSADGSAPKTKATPPKTKNRKNMANNPYLPEPDDGKGIAEWDIGKEVGGDGVRRNYNDRITVTKEEAATRKPSTMDNAIDAHLAASERARARADGGNSSQSQSTASDTPPPTDPPSKAASNGKPKPTAPAAGGAAVPLPTPPESATTGKPAASTDRTVSTGKPVEDSALRPMADAPGKRTPAPVVKPAGSDVFSSMSSVVAKLSRAVGLTSLAQRLEGDRVAARPVAAKPTAPAAEATPRPPAIIQATKDRIAAREAKSAEIAAAGPATQLAAGRAKSDAGKLPRMEAPAEQPAAAKAKSDAGKLPRMEAPAEQPAAAKQASSAKPPAARL